MKRILLLTLLASAIVSNPFKRFGQKIMGSKRAQFAVLSATFFGGSMANTVRIIKKEQALVKPVKEPKKDK